jgi:PAS domain-containing protein
MNGTKSFHRDSVLTHRGDHSETEQRRGFADRRRDRANEQRRLRSVVEQMADGIMVVGGDGLIRYANPAAEQVFGRPAQSLAGRPFGFPLTGDGAAEIDVVRQSGETLYLVIGSFLD